MLAQPIGVVRSELVNTTPPRHKVDYSETVARIELREEFAAGLAGVERCANVFVIWHAHKTPEQAVRLRVRPHGDETRPEMGVFATNCPARPNRLCLTQCAVVSVDPAHGVLVVRGLDAVDGTPVLDIKPEIVLRPSPH